MKRLIASAVTVASVTACAPTGDHIRNNMGGNTDVFLQQRYENDLAQRSVVISGTCTSACIILAASPYACIMPDTILRAHGAWGSKDNDFANRVIVEYLPEKTRRVFMDYIVPNTSPMKFIDIPYQQAVEYGFRGCE